MINVYVQAVDVALICQQFAILSGRDQHPSSITAAFIVVGGHKLLEFQRFS